MKFISWFTLSILLSCCAKHSEIKLSLSKESKKSFKPKFHIEKDNPVRQNGNKRPTMQHHVYWEYEALSPQRKKYPAIKCNPFKQIQEETAILISSNKEKPPYIPETMNKMDEKTKISVDSKVIYQSQAKNVVIPFGPNIFSK